MTAFYASRFRSVCRPFTRRALSTGAFAKSIILDNESPARLAKLRDESGR